MSHDHETRTRRLSHQRVSMGMGGTVATSARDMHGQGGQRNLVRERCQISRAQMSHNILATQATPKSLTITSTMKCYALLIAAIAVQSSDAFSVSSRKEFLSKAVTTVPAIIAATVVPPNSASAADGVSQRMMKQKQADKKRHKEAEEAERNADTGFSNDGPSSGKAGSNDAFCGGKDEADKVNLGTELNKRESERASGLMDKMGL